MSRLDKPRSGDAQPTCSINLLLALKSSSVGTVVVGFIGMACCGDSQSQGGLQVVTPGQMSAT